MHQLKYELELLKRFELMNYKSSVTPVEINHKLDSDVDGEDVDAITFKQLIGRLIYLCNTGPDICYAVGMVNRFMSKPIWSHYQSVVRIPRYVKGTLRHEILFPFGVSDATELIYYSNSDWSGVRVDRRNTTRHVFMYLGVSISWCSKKQPMVALSAREAGNIIDALSACQAIWLMIFLQELKFKVNKPVRLMIVNISTISIAKNLVLNGRSKQIDTRYHFLRNQVRNRVFEVVHISTQK